MLTTKGKEGPICLDITKTRVVSWDDPDAHYEVTALTGCLIAPERLYLTAAGDAVVPEGHRAAASLLVPEGRPVPPAYRGLVEAYLASSTPPAA